MTRGDLAERTRAFVESVVLPAESDVGPDGPQEALRRSLQAEARAAGVFAPTAPEALGGLGLAINEQLPVLEAAGYSPLGPLALNCAAPDEGNMHLLSLVASPDQQRRYLEPLVRGDVRSCFAMSEPRPGAGSDPAALLTTAERRSDGWLINGRKRFITGANGAAFALVVAATAADGDARSASIFMVDADNPGMRVTRTASAPDRFMAGGHCELAFEDCAVPHEALLEPAHHGFRHIQVRLGPARLTHCMRWLGLAQRCLDIALGHAAERTLFGSRLVDLGLAQGLIADCVVDLEASRALIDRAATALAGGVRSSEPPSIAKVFVSEAVGRIADRCIQVCGGDGVTHDLPLSQFASELRAFRIYDGPSEVHRWSIARRAIRRARSAGKAAS